MTPTGRRKIRISDALLVVTYLISVLAFVAVYAYVGPAVSFIFLCFFLLSLLGERRKRYLPTVFLTLVALLVIVHYLYRFTLAGFAAQTVDALLLLLGIKLLQNKHFRDYMQIYLIAVFLLAGSALLGISMLFLAYLIVLVFLFSSAVVLLTYYSEDPGSMLPLSTVTKIVSRAALIPSLALPLAALIFIITPRTPYPLLDFLNQGTRGVTGFTDSIRLGKVSEIQEDNRVILRASMGKIEEHSLYWRGIVLDRFDGTGWYASQALGLAGRRSEDSMLPGGHGVWQEIYLEPYGDRYLFALDKPGLILVKDAREYPALTFALPRPVDKKIRYRALSVLSDRFEGSDGYERRYMQLPPGMSRRITELARQLASAGPFHNTADRITEFLNSGQFSYSLSDLPLTGTPLEDFLFVTRYGNCEYFASAFAVLTRAAGIPTRLVAGYRGGYYNALGGYYLVAQKHAHVWVETWSQTNGWVRYDPTPGVIGSRSPFRRDSFLTARLYLDMISYYWIMFVVNYDLQKQFVLFGKVRTVFSGKGITFKRWAEKKYLALALLLPLLLLFLVRLRKGRSISEEQKLIGLFLKRMEKYGYEKRASQGLEEFVKEIEEPELRKESERIVYEFEETYYRDRKFSKETLKRLRQQIKRLRPFGRIN
jgi:hypothetical protein